ncbi:MAG: hypothetical protein K1X38_02720 [Microthrixaceae bacterium]|nr:hypothetical protein [Microthrixaceae bacterium]
MAERTTSRARQRRSAIMVAGGLVAAVATACPPTPATTSVATIEVVGATDLVGFTAEAYPDRPTVVLLDAAGAPVAGASVRFQLTAIPPAQPVISSRARISFHGGTGAGTATFDTTTDANGRATATPVANEWVGTVGVRATAETTTGARFVTFSLTNRIRPNPGTFPTTPVPGIVDPEFDGSNIWVASLVNGTVSKIRARDGALLGTYSAGSGPDGIAIDADRVWVATCDGIVALDRETGVELARYSPDACYARVVRTPTRLWVVSKAGVAAEYDPATGEPRVAQPVGVGVEDVLYDGRSIWVSATPGQELTQIDDASGVVVSRTQFQCPAGLADGGDVIYVASPCFGLYTCLRKSDRANTADVVVAPPSDDVIGLLSEGTDLWATVAKLRYGGTGELLRIRRSDGQVLDTIPAGTTPLRLTTDGTNVWAAALNDGKLVSVVK